MQARLRTLAFVAAVVTAALVPLFGDPRATPVTHPLWARMLLRALEMEGAVENSPRASDVFATLSWRESLAYPAERFARGDGVVMRDEGGVRRVTAEPGTAEVVYPLAVVQGGDYRLRARLAGQPGRPVSAEIASENGVPALKTFTLVPGPRVDWVYAGTAHLDPGVYSTSLLLPAGTSLEFVEVAPPCLNPIEPAGGWRPSAVATSEDAAVTALKAADLEHALAPADAPIERSGADFEKEEAPAGATGEGFAARALEGGPHGLRASLVVEIPEAGLYTLSAFGDPGGGQKWRADGCRKAMVCPGLRPGWHPVMTQAFSAGRHTIDVALMEGARVERLRLERKKAEPADYVAALRRHGVDPGDGPLTWDKAAEAARFVRGRHRELAARFCGDTMEPGPPPPPLGQVAQAQPPARPAAAPAGSGLGGVLLPPQETATPVMPLNPGP
ncbi:MAG TPA: hypothetical protein VLI67_03035 [Vicinamibacteria bacterium]|nr:hypothetical protein [Vicinamibacteria bacterium]